MVKVEDLRHDINRQISNVGDRSIPVTTTAWEQE